MIRIMFVDTYPLQATIVRNPAPRYNRIMTSEHTQHHISRPTRSRRWLLALTIVLALIQLGAVYRAVRLPDELVSQVSLVTPLEIVMGLGWAAIFVVMAYRLMERKAEALRYAIWVLVAFGIYSLMRLIVFTRADYDRERLPFLFMLTFIGLLIPIGFLIYRTRFQPSDDN